MALVLLLAAALVWASPAASQDAKKKKASSAQTRAIEMNFRNVDLINFVSTMSRALGTAFIWNEKEIRGKITLVSPRKFSEKDAYRIFETVLALHGYTTIRNPGSPVVQIVPLKEAARIPSPTRSTQKGAQGNVFLTQIIPLQFADANQVKATLTPLISKSAALAVYQPANIILLSDTEANINRILQVVKELDIEGGSTEFKVYNLEHASARKLAPILSSLITGQTARPVGKAKRSAARGGGRSNVKVVAIEHTNSLIVVADTMTQVQMAKIIATLDVPGAVQDTGIKVYRLKHADAEDLKKILTDVKKGTTAKSKKVAGTNRLPDVVISSDKATNSLIVFGPPDMIESIDMLVEMLDIRRPQVFVEALIMEMTLEKSLQLGVTWQGTSPTGDAAIGMGFPGATPQTLPQTLGRGAGATLGIVGNEIEFQGQKFTSFSAFIQATRQDQDLNILANPQILTLNNEEAEINVSQVIPVSAKILRDANQNTTTEFEFKDVGIILKITPQITGTDKVRLIIDQTSSSVAARQAGLISAGQQAITTLKRSLKTKVLVDDNTTIAIGGLIQDQQIETVTKVPCLGDIPVLGWFFKSRTEELRKTNLIIFIRIRIIATQEDLEKLSGSVRSRFEDSRRVGSKTEKVLMDSFGLEEINPEEGEKTEDGGGESPEDEQGTGGGGETPPEEQE